LAAGLPQDTRYALELGLGGHRRGRDVLDREFGSTPDVVRDAVVYDAVSGLAGAEVEAVQALLGSQHPSVRARAVALLGSLQGPAVRAVVESAVTDEAWEVQEQAVRSLGSVGRLARHDRLRRSYASPRSDVRRAVVAALASVQADWAREMLESALQD